MINYLLKSQSWLNYSAFTLKADCLQMTPSPFLAQWKQLFSRASQVLCSQVDFAKARMFFFVNEYSPRKIAVHDLFISQNHFRATCGLKAKKEARAVNSLSSALPRCAGKFPSEALLPYFLSRFTFFHCVSLNPLNSLCLPTSVSPAI